MRLDGINRIFSVIKTAEKISGQINHNHPIAERHSGESGKIGEVNSAVSSIKHALFSKLEIARAGKSNPAEIARRYAPILVLPQGKLFTLL